MMGIRSGLPLAIQYQSVCWCVGVERDDGGNPPGELNVRLLRGGLLMPYAPASGQAGTQDSPAAMKLPVEQCGESSVAVFVGCTLILVYLSLWSLASSQDGSEHRICCTEPTFPEPLRLGS